MAVLRAQVTFAHDSGLPRDQSTNVWHFNGPADAPTLTDIAGRLYDFYSLPPDVGVLEVGSWFSPVLSGLYRIRIYDVTEEPAGAPIFDNAGYQLPAPSINDGFPSEVAVCMSFEGAPAAGLVQTRRRGRIYLGPLNRSAGAMVNGIPRPVAGFRDSLTLAAQKLATDVDDTAEWVVYSRPYAGREAIPRVNKPDLPAIAARPGTTVGIDRVWVDDAFDTQRRRGERPTGRGTVYVTD
jgi:hypothetical protein